MTVEKAIDLLDNLVGMIEDNQGNDYDEALKMAINSLGAWERVIEELSHIDSIHTPDEEYEAGVVDGIHLAVRTIKKRIGETKKGDSE